MSGGLQRRMVIGLLILISAVFLINGCALFEDERMAKGRKLYRHYCMHCHGENGRQNEGFNWARMPDPRPRDLSAKSAMETFKDEELFQAVYRDMKDITPETGDTIGDDEFAVPTMPTFKYTLSEDEIWSILAYVRSLHGMDLTFDVEGRRKKLEADFLAAEEESKQAQAALDAAEKKIDEAAAAAEAEGADEGEDLEDDSDAEDEESEDVEEEEEEVILPEETALEEATAKLEAAKKSLEHFTKRPKQGQISRPDLTISSDEELVKLQEKGKQLYFNKYGCNACHSIGDQGGIVGPALDRAGFRLNGTWIYRWIMYPQGIKRHTRMPTLGFNDPDARAVIAYLKTLRAPKPDQPIPPPE